MIGILGRRNDSSDALGRFNRQLSPQYSRPIKSALYFGANFDAFRNSTSSEPIFSKSSSDALNVSRGVFQLETRSFRRLKKKRVTDGFQNVKTLYSTNLLSILVLVQFSKTATPLFCKLYFYIQVARHQTRKFQFKYTRGNDFCIYESLRKSNFKGKAQLSLNFKGKIIRNKYSKFF